MKEHDSRSRKSNQKPRVSWRRVMVRKLLNIPTRDNDYSADSESDYDSNSEEEFCEWPRESRFKNDKLGQPCYDDVNDAGTLPRIRRRKSETFRAQYINTKDIRICAGTWNVGGKIPSDDLDLGDWINTDDPADLYVIGLQEIIPLNAGNIFGAEDNRPVSKWENLIRETLNRVPPATKFISFSDPPSPSRFKPSEDTVDVADEVVLESDSEFEDEIFPINESDATDEGRSSLCDDNSVYCDNDKLGNLAVDHKPARQSSSPNKLDRMNYLRTEDSERSPEYVKSSSYVLKKFNRTISGTERIGLGWPEPALNLLPQHGFERSSSPDLCKSLKASKSFRTYNSVKSPTNSPTQMRSDIAALAEVNLESLINRKRRPAYVRIISKQMVGIFLTIWVRRSLRKHIQNVSVATVGVGVMGYIGNKGSISVSMSIHQTLVCFICTHLSAGEKDTDAIKRNADVQEIHRRTRFNSPSSLGLPRRIYDHERIIWLGDLNYRINLPYDRTKELISKRAWSNLIDQDQLIKELKKGRAFDGWREGTLRFAPTYKYEMSSESYYGEDPKAGRRTPAWCDRILSYGPGMKLLNYKRAEFKLSDHRPVTASYMIEVEVFSPRKLQRALTFTDAEVENQDIVTDIEFPIEMVLLPSEEDASYWSR